MLLDDYIAAASDYESALCSGDSRKANKAFARVESTYLSMKSEAKWDEALRPLLNHPKEGVRLCAAAHLINYREDEAKAALLKIIANKSLVGLVAELTLDRWKAGDLKY